MKNFIGLLSIGLLIGLGSADVSHLLNKHNGYLPPLPVKHLPTAQDYNGLNTLHTNNKPGQLSNHQHESRDYLPPYPQQQHNEEPEGRGYLPPPPPPTQAQELVPKNNQNLQGDSNRGYLPPTENKHSQSHSHEIEQDNHHQQDNRGYLPPHENHFDLHHQVSYHNQHKLSPKTNHFIDEYNRVTNSLEKYEDNSNGYNYSPPKQSFSEGHQEPHHHQHSEVAKEKKPVSYFPSAIHNIFQNSALPSSHNEHQENHGQISSLHQSKIDQKITRDYLPPTAPGASSQGQNNGVSNQLNVVSQQYQPKGKDVQATRDYLPPSASPINHDHGHDIINHLNKPNNQYQSKENEQQSTRGYLPPPNPINHDHGHDHINPTPNKETIGSGLENVNSAPQEDQGYFPPIRALELPQSTDTLHIVPPTQLGLPIEKPKNQIDDDHVDIPLPIPQLGYYVIPAVVTELSRVEQNDNGSVGSVVAGKHQHQQNSNQVNRQQPQQQVQPSQEVHPQVTANVQQYQQKVQQNHEQHNYQQPQQEIRQSKELHFQQHQHQVQQNQQQQNFDQQPQIQIQDNLQQEVPHNLHHQVPAYGQQNQQQVQQNQGQYNYQQHIPQQQIQQQQYQGQQNQELVQNQQLQLQDNYNQQQVEQYQELQQYEQQPQVQQNVGPHQYQQQPDLPLQDVHHHQQEQVQQFQNQNQQQVQGKEQQVKQNLPYQQVQQGQEQQNQQQQGYQQQSLLQDNYQQQNQEQYQAQQHQQYHQNYQPQQQQQQPQQLQQQLQQQQPQQLQQQQQPQQLQQQLQQAEQFQPQQLLAEIAETPLSKLHIIPSVQTAKDLSNEGFLSLSQVFSQHIADIDKTPPAPAAGYLEAGQQTFPPALQTQQSQNQQFKQNQIEVQNTHQQQEVDQPSQTSFENFSNFAARGSSDAVVNNQENQINSPFESSYNNQNENAYLPPFANNLNSQQQSFQNQEQQAYSRSSSILPASVNPNDRYELMQFPQQATVNVSLPSNTEIKYSKPSVIQAYAPETGYQVPTNSFTQTSSTQSAENSNISAESDYSSPINFDLNQNGKQGLTSQGYQHDNTVFPLDPNTNDDEMIQILEQLHKHIQTIQITDHHDNSIKNLQLVDTANPNGERTIEILGPTNDAPQGEHKVLHVISKNPNPEPIHQTIKIFNDRKEVLPNATQAKTNGYLPPLIEKETSNDRKLQSTNRRRF